MIVMLLGTLPSTAVDLESLVSPGPLSAIHAGEADQCADCHARFDREAQNPLCLECHEPIEQDQKQRSGFHGRLDPANETPCRACHGEHRGADAPISTLVPESFDHDRTDMPLLGAHTSVACSACHEDGQPRRSAPSGCVDCHRESDPHEGRLGAECAGCHEPRAWSDTRFDHAKTRFPLEGAHDRVACALCHPAERFEQTPMACVDCHRIDDAHRGQLGSKCGECHLPRSWKDPGFDHRRETGFGLDGRHAKVNCQKCHLLPPTEQKLQVTCIACHREDDDHAGRMDTRCERCHDPRAWSPSRFDHSRDTQWALHGRHEQLACNLCHLAAIDDATGSTPTRCAECHQSVDVHDGSLDAGCERCHGTRSWRSSIRFDHELTRFPLLGLHRLATCEECHATHRFGEAEERCVDCHAEIDEHDKRLGGSCETCHNPNAWNRWQFDHERQTRFSLRGRHVELSCVACHREPTEGAIDLTTQCRGCHLNDSRHAGSFGRDCERCHVEESWETIREGTRR
jgi:hypothetical protein